MKYHDPTPQKLITVNIIYVQAANKYGLARDAEILEQGLKEKAAADGWKVSVAHVNAQSPDVPFSDVAFHLEVPCRLAIPYSRSHFFVVNPEWWHDVEWSWAKDCGAHFIQRYDGALPAGFVDKVFTVHWRSSTVTAKKSALKKNVAVAFIGDSINKSSAIKDVIAAWPSSGPLLSVYGSEQIIKNLREVATSQVNVEFSDKYLSEDEKQQVLSEARFAVVASEAEGFGYALYEAIEHGCFPLWSDIPAFSQFMRPLINEHGLLPMIASDKGSLYRKVDSNKIKLALETSLGLSYDEQELVTRKLRDAVKSRVTIYRKEMKPVWNKLLTDLTANEPKPGFSVPPTVPKELPTVAVLTLTHNRPEWMELAARNILSQNYPRERLVWVVVDDSDNSRGADNFIIPFTNDHKDLRVEYVHLSKKLSIGEKRNRGIKQAFALNPDIQIVAVMDDDDYYFPSSLGTRVAWLVSRGVGAVYSSILPMYDLVRYSSAVNVPPLKLAPAQRCSEATLAFTIDFWKERGFPDVSMAEGEGFLTGREKNTIEISPQGSIVSLLHGKNTSDRRIGDHVRESNGCHFGFSDDLFLFLHKIADVKVPFVPPSVFAGGNAETTGA